MIYLIKSVCRKHLQTLMCSTDNKTLNVSPFMLSLIWKKKKYLICWSCLKMLLNVKICALALILVITISITSTDIPHENERLVFSKQWLKLFARGSGGVEKPTFSKQAMKMINPHGWELSGDEAQQMEAAAKLLSAFGQHPQFAGIARFMLEDNTEEEDRVLKTLQYVMMKRGIGSGFSNFVQEKIEPINKDWERNADTIKEVFSGKAEKHPMKQLFEKVSSQYLQQQFKSQYEVIGKFKELKEMMDKFKSVREYLAANGLK